jgi:hypothetical protein
VGGGVKWLDQILAKSDRNLRRTSLSQPAPPTTPGARWLDNHRTPSPSPAAMQAPSPRRSSRAVEVSERPPSAPHQRTQTEGVPTCARAAAQLTPSSVPAASPHFRVSRSISAPGACGLTPERARRCADTNQRSRPRSRIPSAGLGERLAHPVAARARPQLDPAPPHTPPSRFIPLMRSPSRDDAAHALALLSAEKAPKLEGSVGRGLGAPSAAHVDMTVRPRTGARRGRAGRWG